MSIVDKALEFLKAREFVAVATADKAGKPNAAPKLLLKIDGRTVYFIDYSIGRTFENLKVHPEVSLTLMDVRSLVGYILNGKAEIIEKGGIYDECVEELREREIELSVERVVTGVHIGKPHKEFEVDIPERFLVYKIRIGECFEISPRGVVRQEGS
ncbi:MAG: pyridoxamine 5'-phosphate oxidase family protein [Candidatus Omnitrophica bacterium]|nr:pyridoxamine 5'-phosphate oxidase family protein [Candidatus Omnitrophota bacterium]